MFEEFSRRNRAVMAALTLAATRDWGDVGLNDIAKEANLSLADLRREFVCKNDLLRAFQTEVDAQVLARTKPAGPDDSVRDQVFEALMTRFEVMAPHKEALKRIAAYLRCRPGEASMFVCSRMVTQYWTLANAGAKLDGPTALVRIAGLSAVYGKAFSVWLDDDSPSLDKTMATLDRGLTNGERGMQSLEKVCETVCGLVRGLKRNFGGKDKPDGSASPDSGPVPSSA
ncbi:TetR/AcrR family transcriptional regulator [Methyloceanibacter caenitepidi]|uniref:Transcriptional regulator, TetR family n=1 Tax=Methyloceanibacter caenitepidi TaxID=1384459 RepID=A0A0A8K5Q0_9HYPH|nr:TetR/AcrR family transcriptional regulator [Methyloceanibacter caenitepidi]BAQ18126.1 transcriptional regulator, TetR family [Methyloceanibacter caenitepidi]